MTVEGSTLMLCDRCAKLGVEVRRPATKRIVRPSSRPAARHVLESEYDLASDFHERIRRARESLGWKRDELAKKLNEKLSIVEKLEKGKIRPDDLLVSRLERTLHVGLREKVEEIETPEKSERKPLTLGDLIRRQS
ncbi:MAG: multiprotein bridging factor aMBF1 [Thermoplasmata archaeon]